MTGDVTVRRSHAYAVPAAPRRHRADGEARVGFYEVSIIARIGHRRKARRRDRDVHGYDRRGARAHPVGPARCPHVERPIQTASRGSESRVARVRRTDAEEVVARQVHPSGRERCTPRSMKRWRKAGSRTVKFDCAEAMVHIAGTSCASSTPTVNAGSSRRCRFPARTSSGQNARRAKKPSLPIA